MELILTNEKANSKRIVKVTPEALRKFANDLEREALRVSQYGDTILVPFTNTIVLAYQPEIRSQVRLLPER